MSIDKLPEIEQMPKQPGAFIQRLRGLSEAYFKDFFSPSRPSLQFVNHANRTFVLTVTAPKRFRSEDEQGKCLGGYKRYVTRIFLEGFPLEKSWRNIIPPLSKPPKRDSRALVFKSNAGDVIRISLTSLDYHRPDDDDPVIQVRIEVGLI